VNERRDVVSYPISRSTHLLTNDFTGVRDPYALDVDEDIVMVNAEAEGQVAEKIRRSKTKSKRMVSRLQVIIRVSTWLTLDECSRK
jgi:hypothetical protein